MKKTKRGVNNMKRVINKQEYKVPVFNWCNAIEESAMVQVDHLAQLPFAFKRIAILPDCHAGFGMPIGSVLATEGVVICNSVGVDIGCFSGNTRLPLLNGMQKTLKELTEEGNDVYVYSLDENLDLVAGKATPKLTRKNAGLVEVTISGGEVIRCTPDHQFMLIDGTYKEAQDLKSFDSLMPLYRGYQSRDGYEMIRTVSGSGVITHKMVAKQFLGEQKEGFVAHHKDTNWFNNDPSNIEYKDAKLHSKEHRKLNPMFGTDEFKEKRLKNIREKGFFYDPKFKDKKIAVAVKNFKDYMETDKFKEDVKGNGKRGAKYLIAYNKSEKGRLKSSENGKKNLGRKLNHKVLSVRKLDYREDVYCLTVEKYHNFALSAGVFVHNCGMCAVKTSLKAEQLDKETIKKIFGGSKEYHGGIRSEIPVGFSHHSKKQDESLMPDKESYLFGDHYSITDMPIVHQEYESALKQIGTLGGGNHFIEIQKDEEGYVWIMIHSGSRNIGFTVANYYNKMAVNLNEKWHTQVPKKWELAFLPLDSEEGQMYLREMNYCVEFALANRKLMMDRIIQIFFDVMDKRGQDEFAKAPFTYEPMINIAHNYASMENHFGKNVMIHRKGATLARENTIGIIPGSQGTSSYIVKGLGNADSFMSCSHGAGRTMSRTKAQNELNLEDEIKKMNDLGIVHGLRTKKDLDESASAYKDIDEVMESQADLVGIVHKLSPLAVIKG